MSKKKKNQNEETKPAQEEVQDQEAMNTEQQTNENEQNAPEDPEKKIAELEAAIEHEKKEYLFLMATLQKRKGADILKRTRQNKVPKIFTAGKSP